MAPEAASGKLYHDKFVDIYSDHLCIKSYYFPFGKEKRIEIPFNNTGQGSGVYAARLEGLGQLREQGYSTFKWKQADPSLVNA